MWRAKTYICQKSPRIYLAFLWDQLTISRTWRRHRISVKSVCSDPQNCERKQYKRKYMGEWAKTHKRPTIYASIPTLWNIAYNQCAKQYRCWAPFTLSEHTQLVSPTPGPTQYLLVISASKIPRSRTDSVKGIGIFYTLNKAISIYFGQDMKSKKNIFAKNHREFIFPSCGISKKIADLGEGTESVSKVFEAIHKIVRGNNTKISKWVDEVKLTNTL